MKYTILILYTVKPSFLSLPRAERNSFFEQKVAPIIHEYHNTIEVKMCDSEAFHASVSDFLIIQCADLQHYYHFMEKLRDTALFSKPYIELKDVIIGLEDGFRDFEETL